MVHVKHRESCGTSFDEPPGPAGDPIRESGASGLSHGKPSSVLILERFDTSPVQSLKIKF